MSKKNLQVLNNEKLNKYIMFVLVVISAFLIFLFWQKDALAVYDASGHVSLVRWIREFSWPFLSGWNPNELLGWPQGVFYPSLFHYLAAGISFLIGIPSAIKLLISAAFIALPISLASFARSLTNSKFWAGLITLLLFILISLFPNFLGTGFRSLFQIGLLSNFFVLPILFFFLAFLHKDEPKKYYLQLSLLLSLVILTHLVAALVAAAYFAIFVMAKLLIEKRIELRIYLKVIGLAIVLTAFFWSPFIANLSLTSISRHVSSYLLPNIAVFVAAVLLAVYSWQRKQTNILALSVFAAIFAVLASIDAFLIRQNGTSFVLYSFHIYRFQPFIYLSVATALIISISRHLTVKLKSRLFWATPLAGLVFVLFALLVRNPAELPKASLELKKPEVVSGRFLETFRRMEVDPFWYSAQTSLVEKNTESQWAYGLFTDSTPNGPYLGSLIRSLRPDAYSEGEEIFIETKFIDEQRLPQLLNHFEISYLINLEKEKKKSVGVLKTGKERKFFNAEKAPKTECTPPRCTLLFEVVQLPLKPVETDWEKEMEKWWLGKGPLKDLPYLVGGQKIPEVPQEIIKGSKIQVVSSNQKKTHFELKIDSKEPVPILAKISYFPYWSASSAGEAIPIYRAAPNLMLIYANGEVSLEYKEPTWVKGLYTISAATFLAVGFLFLKKLRRVCPIIFNPRG